MTRFLHTADWQLGMTRHFFADGVQERFAQARLDAIVRMGHLATEHACQFVTVGGDLFESNQVDRQTISRTCEALRSIAVPVFILPGNHDPLNAGSVFKSPLFKDQCGARVAVLDDFNPRQVAPGVELVGGPWKTKKPAANPLSELLAQLTPAESVTRIMLGHGILDRFAPHHSDPAVLRLAELEQALEQGLASFIALGDRHSITSAGGDGRIWYSGSPEPTDFREEKPGHALLVEIDGPAVTTTELPVGRWTFLEPPRWELHHPEDVEGLGQFLRDLDPKSCTVVRLRLQGALDLAQHARLDSILETAADLLAGLDVRKQDLMLLPSDSDIASLELAGFAALTLEQLRSRLSQDQHDDSAQDALRLLMRLAEAPR